MFYISFLSWSKHTASKFELCSLFVKLFLVFTFPRNQAFFFQSEDSRKPVIIKLQKNYLNIVTIHLSKVKFYKKSWPIIFRSNSTESFVFYSFIFLIVIIAFSFMYFIFIIENSVLHFLNHSLHMNSKYSENVF